MKKKITNEFSIYRHLMGQYRIMLRTGSYKIWDEYCQQTAGYKGKVGVPVVLMYPDRHKIVNLDDLDTAIEFLKAVRA
jgi:glutathionyl-hydroquinone reductase